MIDRRGRISVGESYSRVQNSTSQTTVTSVWTSVYRLVVSNAHASTLGTVTVEDGDTTVTVVRIAAGTTQVIELGVQCDDGLKLTNSIAELDTLAIYDTTN